MVFKLYVLVLVVMLRRGFQPSCLGAPLVAIISLASGVWTLLSDDLSSVFFGQSTTRPFECFDFKAKQYIMEKEGRTQMQQLLHVLDQ